MLLLCRIDNVAEDVGVLNVTVLREAGTFGDVSVFYLIEPISATVDEDFSFSSLTGVSEVIQQFNALTLSLTQHAITTWQSHIVTFPSHISVHDQLAYITITLTFDGAKIIVFYSIVRVSPLHSFILVSTLLPNDFTSLLTCLLCRECSSLQERAPSSY